MNYNHSFSVEISPEYDFNVSSISSIEMNKWVSKLWPLVYFINDDKKKIAYVGESTNAISRFKSHLANPERCKLRKISIIGSDNFNKSATLDIESNLIRYLSSEGTYHLQNGNLGLNNHNYFQKELYSSLFNEVWSKLIEKKIVTKSLRDIENSELFKFSPYKSLNKDQYHSLLEILESLVSKQENRIFISGSAGTGKTVLASYLIKLLVTDIDSALIDEYNDEELYELNLIQKIRNKYKTPKIGFVVAMSSLRGTLSEVFRKTPGLSSSMILSPSDTFKSRQKYDLLIVDEAHRLRQYNNIGWRKVFNENNKKLGLDNTGTELDWIIANSRNQIFFYDAAQSVRPSDVPQSKFDKILGQRKTIKLALKSQMRVLGGNDYIKFVDDLLTRKNNIKNKYSDSKYELKLFDSFKELYKELTIKENENGLCRVLAGYSWPWSTKDKGKKQSANKNFDIELDGLRFKWNTEPINWINSPTAFQEIGCIHTSQGYDLNYAGVIFGKEIDYDPESDQIIVYEDNYFDKNGKIGISDPNELKGFIINIYKTILCRGIRGTYVYAYHKPLREYLKRYIHSYGKGFPFKVLPVNRVRPYINSIPHIDISVAAGNFDEQADPSEFTWVEPPMGLKSKAGSFICKVVGESMNKVIPNGSYCLFKKDEGGSREGKIVLVECADIQDRDFGAGYTVKRYFSKKDINEETWHHNEIILKPESTDQRYKDLILDDDRLHKFRIKGVFVQVLE